MTEGGRFGGFGLFVKDGKLVYHYNWVGLDRYEIAFTIPGPIVTLPTHVTLKAVYKSDDPNTFGAGATVTSMLTASPLVRDEWRTAFPTA